MVIDTHAHLNDPAFDSDRDEIIKKTKESGIWVINVGYNRKTSVLALGLAGENEGFFAAVGLHPNNLEEGFQPEIYRSFLADKKVVAIGETGLDYYRLPGGEPDKKIKVRQKEIFGKHLDLALEFEKPLIIHCREANDEILDILDERKEKNSGKLKGVAHSFVGNYRQARRYRELGFKISVNGIITYARDYDKLIRETPIEDILVETDCPYLTPVPYRGRRNEPVYIQEVLKKLAEIKEISEAEAERITEESARDLFGV